MAISFPAWRRDERQTRRQRPQGMRTGCRSAHRCATSYRLDRLAIAPMTPAERRYQRAGVQLRIARAQLLLQIARDDAAIADLLTFAGQIGDTTAADTLAAFRAAQIELLQAAQAELSRLPRPDEVEPTTTTTRRN